MFVGKKDVLGTPENTRWERDQIKSVVHYEEIDGADHCHFTLNTKKDYLKDVIELIKKYSKSFEPEK